MCIVTPSSGSNPAALLTFSQFLLAEADRSKRGTITGLYSVQLLPVCRTVPSCYDDSFIFGGFFDAFKECTWMMAANDNYSLLRPYSYSCTSQIDST
jgi:hypothetical protein